MGVYELEVTGTNLKNYESTGMYGEPSVSYS